MFFSGSSKQALLNKDNSAKWIQQLEGTETSFSLIVPLLCEGLEDQGNCRVFWKVFGEPEGKGSWAAVLTP